MTMRGRVAFVLTTALSLGALVNCNARTLQDEGVEVTEDNACKEVIVFPNTEWGMSKEALISTFPDGWRAQDENGENGEYMDFGTGITVDDQEFLGCHVDSIWYDFDEESHLNSVWFSFDSPEILGDGSEIPADWDEAEKLYDSLVNGLTELFGEPSYIENEDAGEVDLLAGGDDYKSRTAYWANVSGVYCKLSFSGTCAEDTYDAIVGNGSGLDRFSLMIDFETPGYDYDAYNSGTIPEEETELPEKEYEGQIWFRDIPWNKSKHDVLVFVKNNLEDGQRFEDLNEDSSLVLKRENAFEVLYDNVAGYDAISTYRFNDQDEFCEGDYLIAGTYVGQEGLDLYNDFVIKYTSVYGEPESSEENVDNPSDKTDIATAIGKGTASLSTTWIDQDGASIEIQAHKDDSLPTVRVEIFYKSPEENSNDVSKAGDTTGI